MPELIPLAWLESAITEAVAGAVYFRDLHRHPRIARLLPKHGDILRLLEEAAHSLQDYSRYLEDELMPQAHGEIACGGQHFERILHFRHFLDIDTANLYDLIIPRK